MPGHHILGHAHGGATAPDNGVLLCGHHHHTVHDDGWQIVIADDGVPEFIPPPTIDPTRAPRRNHRQGSPVRRTAGPGHSGSIEV